MIVDARSLPGNETIETDVCIVGAGVAGITLANELRGQPFRVALLESGGLESDHMTQSLCMGENIGHPYYPLDDAYARCFGGSSSRWHLPLGDGRLGARLHPLDAIDFEERDWIPYSGWPFDKEHLAPYYERAQTICQVGPFTYAVEDWEDPIKTPRLPFDCGQVQTTIFQFCSRAVFVSHYREAIHRAPNITTYLYANVVDIETTNPAKMVTRVRVACLPGNTFGVVAKLFILALGGLETPRLLLLSNRTQNTGLGNQHDLVGRFFMEHPHLWSGLYIPAHANIFKTTALYQIHPAHPAPIMGKLTLAEDVIRREKILNYCVSIHPSPWPKAPARSKTAPSDTQPLPLHVLIALYDASKTMYRKMRRKVGQIVKRHKRPPPSEVFRLNHMIEQVPNPNSRVTLSTERDALGLPRVRLDWQVSAIDIRSMIRAQEIIDEELRRASLGRLQIELTNDTPPPDLHGGRHQMGTTRMHLDPKKGVVNEHGQVHGVSNLFIAGPSVFPTCGYANPTLTTVALSARLADHVIGHLKG